MALIKCPECGNDVSTEAAVCPKCGYPIKKTEKAEPAHEEKADAPVKKRKGNGCGAAILTFVSIIVAFFVILSLFTGSCSELPSSKSKEDSWNSAINAKSYAQIMVKNNLKAPSTAKFCNSATEMKATNLGGYKWKVTGWVDAQNSFGAMVRSDFVVTLTLNKDGAVCNDIEINTRK